MSCNCELCQRSNRLESIIEYYNLNASDKKFLLELWESLACAETDLEMERINRAKIKESANSAAVAVLHKIVEQYRNDQAHDQSTPLWPLIDEAENVLCLQPPCREAVPQQPQAKIPQQIFDRLEAVETIIGGITVPTREELDCADQELESIIAELSAMR